MSDLRIVSLVPSATEMVFCLGAGEALVGRSHVCDYPAEARLRPILTEPRLAATSSRGIHDELRERLSNGLAVYDVDLDRLRSLEPTHLLMQDQCSVCALAPGDLKGALADWLGAAPQLVSVAPQQLRDVWHDIQTIGDAIGRASEASRLQSQLSERLSGIAESVGTPGTRPRVACIEWLDPLMISGHWVPELVRIAGGAPVLAQTGGASTTLELDVLVDAAPDVLVVQICGFDLETSMAAWAADAGLRPGLARWPGPPPRVFITDGAAFFNRPGPRLVETAEILTELLHADPPPGADPAPDSAGMIGRHHGRHYVEIRVER